MGDPHSSDCTTKSPIPRSRSDFNYVNLTPKEKRRTSEFSHLLTHFHREPPYVRLLDARVPIVEQPTSLKQPGPEGSRMCRSMTGHNVAKVPNTDVIRSQSMKSLQKTLEASPTKHPTAQKPCSLTPLDVADQADLARLRNFSITAKGLVNWGDSFRSRSMPFVPAGRPVSATIRESCSAATFHVTSPRASSASTAACGFPTKYKIAIMGTANVGKTTMIKQFRTSEYICAFDGSGSIDETSDSAITVVLNGEESDLEFIDCCSLEAETDDETGENCNFPIKPFVPTAEAYVVVYSVTSRRSFHHALKLVSLIQNIFLSCVVVLVGNKSDLVRIRAVTTDEGRTAAKDRNCRFLETSVAINHQVDELLVSILTEIRTVGNPNLASGGGSPQHCSLTKAKGLLKKFLKKACFQSKSCDNLQRL